jgi:hypothetical protein
VGSGRPVARFRGDGRRPGTPPTQRPALAGPETALTETADEDHPEFWSRDGKTLLFIRRSAEDAQGAWALHLAYGKVEPLLDARFRVDEPQLSPDERWLAYVSHESGRDEVYVEPYRRAGDRMRVSVDGGGQPKWRGDGKELFYTTPDNLLMAVAVRAAGERARGELAHEALRGPRARGAPATTTTRRARTVSASWSRSRSSRSASRSCRS